MDNLRDNLISALISDDEEEIVLVDPIESPTSKLLNKIQSQIEENTSLLKRLESRVVQQKDWEDEMAALNAERKEDKLLIEEQRQDVEDLFKMQDDLQLALDKEKTTASDKNARMALQLEEEKMKTTAFEQLLHAKEDEIAALQIRNDLLKSECDQLQSLILAMTPNPDSAMGANSNITVNVCPPLQAQELFPLEEKSPDLPPETNENSLIMMEAVAAKYFQEDAGSSNFSGF